MDFTNPSLFVGPLALLPCLFMGFTNPSLFVGPSTLWPRPCYRLCDLVTFLRDRRLYSLVPTIDLVILSLFCGTVDFIASSLL